MVAVSDPISIARQCFEAYANSDQDAIDKLIAPDMRFTSPYDNGINRDTYFARCWPNHQAITKFVFVRVQALASEEGGDEVLVTYEGETDRGTKFRNTEILTIRNGQIVAVEVYFGWNVPHPAPPGGFVDP